MRCATIGSKQPIAGRRHGVRALALALAMIAAAAPTRAQQPSAPADTDPRIIVTGEGSVSVAPDYAQVSGGVRTEAPTAKDATDANSKAMTAVIAALRDAGIAQKDIQTSQFAVRPVYVQQSNNQQKLSGFSVSNQVTVQVRQLGQLGDVLDRMVRAGATDIGNVALLHADLSKELDQARQGAIADARRKAELYAHASGVTLGPVVWITEETAYPPPVPFGARAAAAPAMSAVPVTVGEDKLQARVTVGFAVAH